MAAQYEREELATSILVVTLLTTLRCTSPESPAARRPKESRPPPHRPSNSMLQPSLAEKISSSAVVLVLVPLHMFYRRLHPFRFSWFNAAKKRGHAER